MAGQGTVPVVLSSLGRAVQQGMYVTDDLLGLDCMLGVAALARFASGPEAFREVCMCKYLCVNMLCAPRIQCRMCEL